jgi:hypothetical protein
MYTTCLHCHHNLGVNQSIEAFPVGRRVAFDASRGRLWAVCSHCQRWNLAPLDERWEAIEQCEQLFRGTRIRSSTDHIGLARLREGTDLVRIGDPLRPEFAAWRYSDTIVRRRRRNLVIGGVTLAAASAVGIGIVATGVGIGALNVLNLASGALRRRRDRRVVFRDEAAGEGSAVTAGELDELALLVPGSLEDSPLAIELHRSGKHGTTETFEGPHLMTLAGLALARRNRTAGRPAHIRAAVDLLDRLGNPFADPSQARQWIDVHPGRGELFPPRRGTRGGRLRITTLDAPTRLALEMAAHEERERLFLASHLSLLEAAWKEAEEIARIADDLLVPDWIRHRLGR